MSFKSVSIDGKDMYETYGLILASKEIGQPSPQTKMVDVPLRDGAIDLTEVLTDSIKYDDRKITMTFLYMGDDAPTAISTLCTAIHGKKLKIIFDEDTSFYYLGRISVESATAKKKASTIKITAECEPFKYDVNDSAVDWEWDTFDFENGIINEAGELEVSGTASFTLICRRDREWPTFTASTAMTMTYNGVTYSLKAGSQKLYRCFFVKGNNELTFNGTGTITISYTGGTL